MHSVSEYCLLIRIILAIEEALEGLHEDSAVQNGLGDDDEDRSKLDKAF